MVLLIGVIVIVGALTFFPVLSLGPIVEHFLAAGRQGVLSMAHPQAVSIFHGPLVRPALLDSLKKLSPAAMARNPVMFVVEVGSVLTTLLWLATCTPRGRSPAWFTGNVSALAVVHGALRQLRGGAGRGARQGAGGRPARPAQGDDGPQAAWTAAR